MQDNNRPSDEAKQDRGDKLEVRSLSQPPRKHRFSLIISLALILLILIGVFSPLHDIILNRFVVPTPTVIPGDNLFFIQSIPPGTIFLDGHTLAQVPQYPNLDTPLRLAPGSHLIVWQALPFNPLSCTVFVPSFATGRSCPYESPVALNNGTNAWLITFTPSLSDLSSSQRTALQQRIQATLTPLQSTTMVVPGEQYLGLNAAGFPAPTTATEPLKATLSFHLDADPNSPRSCVGGFGDTCTYNGQNCLELCQTTYAASTWLVMALYYPTWTYTTQSGHVVAQGQLDTDATTVATDHTMQLQIQWSHGTWNVVNETALPPNLQHPDVGQLTGLDTTPKMGCASVTGLVKQSTLYHTIQEGNRQQISWRFYTGSNRADGCLGIVVPNTSPGVTPAYFLYRFGILIAANSLAHQYFPSLPVADALEQQVASGIAQQNRQEIASAIDPQY